MRFIWGYILNFRKILIAVLLLVVLLFILFEYVLPLRECRESEVIMTSLVDENNLLKITCDIEKFEDKWANIANVQNNKKKDTNEETNTFTDDNISSIIF